MTRATNKPTESNPQPFVGTPAIPPGVQDHNFHTQAIFNIHGQVAGLEKGQKVVEERLLKVEDKLETVRLDVHGAKKMAAIFGGILSVMGAIGLLILNKVADAIVSHYKPGH